MFHGKNGYCIVLTIVAPYRAALDLVLPLKRGDVKEIAAAIGHEAFTALTENPTETGGQTAILPGAALRERLRTREAMDRISQIDSFETRRAMKHLANDIGDDGREIVLARYERPPTGGYESWESAAGPLTPTPFRAP